MARRLTITGSTLRSRDADFKSALAAAVQRQVWPLIEAGKFPRHTSARCAHFSLGREKCGLARKNQPAVGTDRRNSSTNTRMFSE
jgi:hypothetical protein